MFALFYIKNYTSLFRYFMKPNDYLEMIMCTEENFRIVFLVQGKILQYRISKGNNGLDIIDI
jgi:hypothetical protein